MAKLILSLDGTVIREFPLSKERMTIGRKPQNDIQVDNLAVSGEHAAIITILNDSFMEDLGSTNGTLVNGNPVKKHFLQNGDVIEIGKHKLKYLNELQSSTSPADFERTMVLRRPEGGGTATLAAPTERALNDTQVGVQPFFNGSPSQIPTGHGAAVLAPPAPAAAPPAHAEPAPPAQPPAAIQVLNGNNAGRVLDLVKTLTTLGKPQVQVAVITRRPTGYFITHVEGTRYPVVNGVTLSAQAAPLKDHDIIEIAGVKMEFFHKTARPD